MQIKLPIELIDHQKKTVERYAKRGEISDGYHTFADLYAHRLALTKALMLSHPTISWRSKQHHVGGEPMFDGFFIIGMNLSTGMITYHYKLKFWDEFAGITELEHAPKWDGHTPEDVTERLKTEHWNDCT